MLLYVAAVLWTVGYDTIYAMQDLEDDAVVGIRSSARTFGAYAREAVAVCYLGAALLAGLAAWLAGAGLIAFIGLAAFAAHLGWQVASLGQVDPRKALALFRANRDAGLILAAGFALDCVARNAF